MAGSGTTNIQLCGRLAVEIEGRRVEDGLPGGQGRLLFAFLAVNRARAVRRDEMIEAIWPEAPPSSPELGLSAVLSRLRRTLGDGALHGRSEMRLVLPADAWVDLEAAAEAIHRAESAISAGDWGGAYGPGAVARLISGREFLAGEADSAWIAEVRHRLEDIHQRALECDVASSLGIGGAEISIGLRSAHELVALAPERESGHRLLMEALERSGDPAEALRVYERLRCLLRDELGTTPSSATQAVHARLLASGGG